MKKMMPDQGMQRLKVMLMFQLALVVLPLIALLLGQTWWMGYTSARIAQAQQLAREASEVRTHYQQFLRAVYETQQPARFSMAAHEALRATQRNVEVLQVYSSPNEMAELRPALLTLLNKVTASGDIEDWRALRIHIERTHDGLEKMVQALESASEVEIHSLNQMTHRAQLATWVMVLAVILVSAYFVLNLMRRFTTPIERAVYACMQMAKGNLSQHVMHYKTEKDIGGLMANLDTMRRQFSDVMHQIEESGKHMNQSACQIAAISKEIGAVNKKEEVRAIEVNNATSDVTANSFTIEGHATAASELAAHLQNLAKTGIGTVQRNIVEMSKTVNEVTHTSEEIESLAMAASEIHQIITSIKAIANQTEMLALNAAIEAARAGEQGRGFTVVADQVRSLAERTTASAGEVSDILGRFNLAIGRAKESMTSVVARVHENEAQAGTTAEDIQSIVDSISRSAHLNHDIAQASRKQIDKMAQLRTSLDELFVTLAESTVKVGTTATIGDTLYGITEKLNAMMAGFQLETKSAEEMANDNRRAKRTKNNLLVRIKQGDAFIEAVSCDLSLTGMCLAPSAPLATDVPLEIAIFLPHEQIEDYLAQKPLMVRSRIAWQRMVDGQRRCGVEFLEPDPSTQEKIQFCYDFYQ